MKILQKFILMALLPLIALAASSSAFAVGDATAPYQNPTYIPTFTIPSTGSLPTGAQNLTYSTFGSSVFTGLFSGTCTSLAATAQGSVDNGASWTTINAYIYPALGTAAGTVAVAGAITNVLFKLNVQGFNKVRIVVSALAGTTCSFAAAETQGDFNGLTL